MIYNTNLDFRMMHILDAFDTSSMHSTTDCMNIANFLQVALYLKCCSKMAKDIEPTGFISKSKVRNKIGFYLYRQNRWDVFASRTTIYDYEYYKASVKTLFTELEESLPIDIRVNFMYLYNGKYDYIEYKCGKNFRNVFIAMDQLDTQIDSLEDLAKDATIFKLLVINELERRCGRKYTLAQNIMQIHADYEESNDISVVNNVEFLDHFQESASKKDTLLKSMGWTLR